MRAAHTIGITGAAVAIAIAGALPALADPPPAHGNGNGNSAHVPPGQAKKSPPPVLTPTPTPSATPSHVPPGQAKKGTRPHPTHPAHPVSTGGVESASPATGHNPPGNNGTVKIHSVAGDTSHHNVPHVSCSSFFVDFWGFDAGQTLDVSFEGQAPTGKGVPITFTAPDGTSVTSPDAAGGGNDFDGELGFIATPSALAVLGAPAHQGYHVRLLVATHQGGGMKQKVFWIAPCVTTPSSPAITTPTPTPQLHVASRHVVVPDTPTRSGHGALVQHGPVVQSASLMPSLPFTGADIAATVVAGLVALSLGTLLTVAVRRRKIG